MPTLTLPRPAPGAAPAEPAPSPLPPAAPAAPAAGPVPLRRVLQDRHALLGEVVEGRRLDLTRVLAVSLAMTALGGLGLGVASKHALQPLVAAVKVPLIGLGALAVCFPAFYIFALLQGSRLTVDQALRLFTVALGLRGAVVAGLAPLLLFFSAVGSPYGFLLLAGAAVFGLAEVGFVRTLEDGVRRLQAAGDAIRPAFTRLWTVVYLAVVGQLAWSFRPIIGNDLEEWRLFGGQGTNMFTYFFAEVGRLGGG